MAEIYEKYFKESFEGGKLTDIKLEVPHDFNFAYDVVDEIALSFFNRPCSCNGAYVKGH